MPTYEYRCKKCDQIFEYVQSFDDPPKKSRRGCPEGGSCQLKKVYGSVGISFKGGGFYKNDSKKGSSSSASSSSDSSSSESSTADSSSTSSSGSSDSAA